MSNRVLWMVGVATVVLAASLLTACTISLSGGIAGIVSTLALLGLLFGIGATQSGCSDDSSDPCLATDIGPPPSDGAGADFTACLSLDPKILELGACLQPPIEVGPCLSLDAQGHKDAGHKDAGHKDANVGPCLSPPAWDANVGPCLSPPAWDANVGPCLSPPPPQPGAALVPALESPSPTAEPVEQLDRQRASAISRLGPRLPPDVVARLSGKRDERS